MTITAFANVNTSQNHWISKNSSYRRVCRPPLHERVWTPFRLWCCLDFINNKAERLYWRR